MGAEKMTGTLEKGKAAGFLVVEADPTRDIASLRRLRFVVRAGAVHPIAELRAPSPAR